MPQCQFLFSAVFVFQKSCTENILGIAWHKLPVPYNHVTKTVPEDDLRGASQVARPHPGAARAWPAPGWRLGPGGVGGAQVARPPPGPARPGWVLATWAPPTPPIRLFIPHF